jgi:hypothetical protein
LVHIFVGSSRKEYILSKQILCTWSAFFSAAFSGTFAEASTSSLSLPDDDPEIFTFFTYWLMDRRYDLVCHLDSNQFISLYIFADKIKCDKLKNFTMDRIQDRLHESGSFLTIRQMAHIFENAASATVSPLRIFCAASMSHAIMTQQ